MTTVEIDLDTETPRFIGPLYVLTGISNGQYQGAIAGIGRSDLEALRDAIGRTLAQGDD